jgi:hypothetical protein
VRVAAICALMASMRWFRFPISATALLRRMLASAASSSSSTSPRRTLRPRAMLMAVMRPLTGTAICRTAECDSNRARFDTATTETRPATAQVSHPASSTSAMASPRTRRGMSSLSARRVREKEVEATPHYPPCTANGKPSGPLGYRRFGHVNCPRSRTTRPRTVVNTPRSVVNTPRTVVNTPRTVVNSPCTVVNTPRTVVNSPRTVVNTPFTVVRGLDTGHSRWH